MGQAPPAPSGRKRQGAQSSQCAAELGFPGPAPGQMQSEAAGLAGDRPAREKNRRRKVLVVTICSPRPMRAVQVPGCEPSAGRPARRRWLRSGPKMVQPHAVLQVSDGVFDLGVAAMVGLQIQGVPVPVGDEAVIAVGGEEGQLGSRARASPAGR